MQIAIKDLLAPLPVDYSIIISDQLVSLWRRGPSGLVESVWQTPLPSTDADGLSQAFTNLIECKYYYGQPCGVVIDNNDQFTYMRLFGQAGLTGLYDKLQRLKGDEWNLTQATLKTKTGSVLIAQGIRISFLETLRTVLEKTGLQPTFITTMPVYVAARLKVPMPSEEQVADVLLPDSAERRLVRQGDAILYIRDDNIQLSAESEIGDATEEADHTSHARANKVDLCSSSAVSTASRLASAVHHALSVTRDDPKLFLHSSTSKGSRFLQTAVNALKLVTTLLSLVFIIIGCAAVLSMSLRPPDDYVVQHYQRLYTEKLQLETSVQTLQNDLDAMKPSFASIAEPSAVIAAFCQKSLPRVYLTEIAVSYTSPDTTRVEASGRAKAEADVFAYHTLLQEYVGGLDLNLQALAPELVYTSGQADTVVGFTMAMEVVRAARP